MILRKTWIHFLSSSLALFTGCSNWKTVQSDEPWIGPKEQLVEQQKRHAAVISATSYVETRWLDKSNNEYDLNHIATDAQTYLYSTSTGSNLLKSDTWPWKAIVSIRPTVVLLVPSDPMKVKRGDLLGMNHPVRTIGNAKYGGCDYGSVDFYNEGMKWYSPDLKQEPSMVSFADGKAEIQLPNGKLRLIVRGEVCKITRD